ncbi:hypothetical protein RBB68_06255 [Leptospira interrogans]|uniref:Uncharacterized protein n=8 Tax=Leptospira interrogans TaxID=173 RepID=Q72SX6_LEPIC|nr:hypothetical protein [Leptospira interrogans]EMG20043.1 hypothetical protein LEP1GSC150_3272 [Leptospira interrogans serovar Copenhageni str. LT2050]AAS69852.1 conserved hypothetical protein [Leptospira interrogans serovar Copenhageni str. Fiocruz L1-130]KPA34973.1 Uncharacterized protein AMR50_0128 [Leptospira interrogans]MBO7986465.1 hypothetical protein [Leptospira interrogans serovar Copenhageni]MBO7990258.1 hypothetical protein [Leptospira interrogans serovar Copenhageni]
MAEDYEMVKDDNSHEEGRNVGMDELQFDDIDSILSSEPENLNINPDPLESLVASSGEDYPSSFENDFVFHPEETTGSANFNIEDTLDLELTDPLVDAEIDKLLDINDITSISEISNLESDDSFFIPGDSAPDDGIDFSELDNSLTEEPDAFSFGEESEDLEGFELSDQNEEFSQEDDFLGDEEGPIALSKTELGEIAPAVEDDLPDFISTSVDSEIEEENIAESMLGGTSVEADVLPDTLLDELEEDAPIALSGDELDNILNASTADDSDDDLPDFITHVENEDFSLPVEQDSSLLSSDTISNSSLFEDFEEEEKISLPEHELEEIENPVLSEEDSLSFEDFELPTNDLETSEISLEDEEANEPIALSDEELGNLLASENEELTTSEESNDLTETIDWDSPGSEVSLEDEEANEPIALSDEELGNLLASENEELTTSEESNDLSEAIDWDSPPTSETSLEDEESNEPIALSDEELGNLLASENEEPAAISEESNDLAEAIDWDSSPTSETSLEDEEANEPIALSDKELGNLLASENEELTTSEESNDLAEAIDWDSSPTSEISLEDEEANEPIALSDEELGNLLASENEELTTSEESNDLTEAIDSDSPPTSETSLEDEESNEPIALSDEELGNLLASENEEPAAISEESNDLTEAIDWDSPPTSETSLEDEEANEPIALSDEELGNLLASENEELTTSEESNDLSEAIDWDSSPTSEVPLEDEESNEPIALSLDELDHILTDENEEPAATSQESSNLTETIDWDSPGSETSLEDEEANEPIALSLDELDHILTDENEEPAAISEESNDLTETIDWDSPGSETSLEDEEANEPIALSLDELDHILTDENEEPAATSEESNDLTETIDWDSPGSETSLEDEEANEPIALSLDELDHILTDENEEPAAISEESNDLAETIDWDSSPGSEISLEDEEANEPIAFSDEELGNLLASGNEESEDKIGSDIPKVETEEDLSEILGELPPVSDLDAFDSIDEDVSKEEEVSTIVPTLESVKDQEMIIVLDEYADEEESSPIEELRKTPDQTEAIVGELSGDVPSKDEMKRIMTYLDELLGNLPDDLIREFSRSDYFELYKKLMKQIGV